MFYSKTDLWKLYPDYHKELKFVISNISGIMTPEELFYQVFLSLPRQGPGCMGATRKAYSYLPTLPKDAKILDIGCGSGSQTRELANLTSGIITAVDNYQPFLDTLTIHGKNEGLERENQDRLRLDGFPAV